MKRPRTRPTHFDLSGWQAPSRFLQPFHPAFVAAMHAGARSVWDAIDGLAIDRSIQAVFDRARDADNGFALPDDVLFPAGPFPFQLVLASPDGREPTSVMVEDAPTLRGLRDAMSGEANDELSIELAEELREAELLVDSEAVPIDARRPGVYRLQHASVLFRSETTTIVSDPVFADGWLWAGALPPVDAVLVSHAHGDHFSLPSLMQFPRDTKIVVPLAERGSMLGDDMATVLRLAGFTDVVAVPWYSRIRVGDLDVWIYPFYGEQPWVTFAQAVPGLRNAGNTYLVDIHGHKTWILVDAGDEHGHTMLDVARRVRDEHGEIDLVLSNLRTFPWHPGQIDGSGRFLFCYPLDVLADPSRWPHGKSVTLGPGGVREVLKATGARDFLPYAHWWHEPGSDRRVIDRMTPETDLVDEIDASAIPCTRLHRWRVGDRVDWSGGDLAIESFL